MRIELMYGDDGTINGHMISYEDSLKPHIEDNEYIIDDEDDLKTLTEYLIAHPKAKTISKGKCKLNLCIKVKNLNKKLEDSSELNSDEIESIEILKKGVRRDIRIEIKNNKVIIHNLK